MPGGHPPIFKTPQEMSIKIDEYFKLCDERKKSVVTKESEVIEIPDPARYTIPGLAYHLGFKQRTQLPDYAKDRPEFSDTISRARLKIECQRVENLVEVGTKNSNGIKFDLVNNWDYKDRQEVEHSGKIDSDVKLDISGMDNIKLLDVIKQQTVNK